jgi:hypothetical protein
MEAGQGDLTGRPPFFVNERQQLRGGAPVAAVGCFQESRRVGHLFGSGSGVASQIFNRLSEAGDRYRA